MCFEAICTCKNFSVASRQQLLYLDGLTQLPVSVASPSVAFGYLPGSIQKVLGHLGPDWAMATALTV